MPSSRIVLFAFFAAAFVVSRAQLSECPDGWMLYPKSGKCFQAVRGSFTYEEAVAECVSRKGMLASVNSKAESHFIKEYIESATPKGTGVFWNGRQCRDGHWAWLDGSKTNVVPHRACQSKPGYREVVFVASGEISYHAMPCHGWYGALCQRKAVATARVVDGLETALAHSEERVKALEGRVASMEKTEHRMQDKMAALVASTRFVEEALAHAEELISALQDRMAAMEKAEGWNRAHAPFAPVGIAIVLWLLSGYVLYLENARLEAATDDCTTEDEKEHDAEEEVPTYCEDEDSDDSSYGHLIDDSME